VIRSCEPDNPVHLTFQRGFNDCRLALSASDTAHVRRVQFELAGDAAVKATEEGCEVERGALTLPLTFVTIRVISFLDPLVTTLELASI